MHEDNKGELLRSIAGVIDEGPVALAVFDRDMRLKSFNRTFTSYVAAYSGLDPLDVVVGAHAAKLIPGVEEWAPEALEQVLSGQVIRLDSVPVEGPKGVSYWDVMLAPVVEDGEMTGVAELSVEATERVVAYRDMEERVAERTGELERRRQVAEGLHMILRSLNSCCPREEVLDFIISEAGRLLKSPAVSIYRVDISAGALTMLTSYGIADQRVKDLVIPVVGKVGYVARTIAQSKPMVVPNTRVLRETAVDAMPPEQQELLGSILDIYGAVLAVPIVTSDQLYGALTMYYHEPREFSDEEVVLAADLADHLALALENAQLRERAEEAAALGRARPARARPARRGHADALLGQPHRRGAAASVGARPDGGPPAPRAAAQPHARRARRDAHAAAGAAAGRAGGGRPPRPAAAAGRGRRRTAASSVEVIVRGRSRDVCRRTCRWRCTASRRRRSTTSSSTRERRTRTSICAISERGRQPLAWATTAAASTRPTSAGPTTSACGSCASEPRRSGRASRVESTSGQGTCVSSRRGQDARTDADEQRPDTRDDRGRPRRRPQRAVGVPARLRRPRARRARRADGDEAVRGLRDASARTSC